MVCRECSCGVGVGVSKQYGIVNVKSYVSFRLASLRFDFRFS